MLSASVHHVILAVDDYADSARECMERLFPEKLTPEVQVQFITGYIHSPFASSISHFLNFKLLVE